MAKKAKPAKKPVVKKAAQNPKQGTKKSPVKKTVVKKVTVKKAALKKPFAKKAASPKRSAKNPNLQKPVKKAMAKKGPVKKIVPVKAVAKKPISKKGSAKKTGLTVPALKKQVTVKTVVRRKAAVKPETIPVVQPDALVEKAANTARQPMMAPGDGLNEAPVLTNNPVNTFSQNEFNRATAKGDPHSNMQLSSSAKNSIKPSGKKPLWRK